MVRGAWGVNILSSLLVGGLIMEYNMIIGIDLCQHIYHTTIGCYKKGVVFK